jgi:ABC-2 type transport system permease protein/oleandomycin transport system permease protein
VTTISAQHELAIIVEERGGGGLRSTFSDVLQVTKRNLIKMLRIPQQIIFSTIQPVMLLLLFTYVFGGLVTGALPGGIRYRDYILPAVLIQTVTFAAMATGIGLATDLQTGMIDRFRSLPMARSAYLAGRNLADGVRVVVQIVLMVVVGYVIGFRFHAGPIPALGMVAVCVLFGLSFSWISAFIGISLRDPETTQAAGFIWMFPFIFASTAFSPVERLPGWMQGWARINPISSTADSVRALALGGPTFTATWHALAWIIGIMVVFSVLSVRAYRQAV